MKPLEEAASRQILEVSAEASLEDITAAYLLLKRIHGSELGIFGGSAMEEFSPDARREALAEIEAAYRLLRALSTQATPLSEEAPATQQEPAPRPEPPPRPEPIPRPEPAPAPAPQPQVLRKADAIPGSFLEGSREAAGFSLEDVAAETHVPMAYLQALEEERFGDLPLAPVRVRGFLTAFVTAIGLGAEDIVPPYMEKFQQWQTRHRA